MTITIELTQEEETRLLIAARSKGLGITDYVHRLIGENLPRLSPGAATLALLAQWDAEDATDDPAELKARDAEWQELQANLEANRLSLPIPEV